MAAGFLSNMLELVKGKVAKKRADALAASGADPSKPVPVEQQPLPELMTAATTLAPPVDPMKKRRNGSMAALTLQGRQPLSGGLL
jgi:hypothetical protein